jgi:hypothetical protein
MKISTNYFLAKIKDLRPDGVAIALIILLAYCVGAVPLVLFIVLGKVSISNDGVALATMIGGITGPVLSFLTLAFVLLNNVSDAQEKLFQQALVFTERLLNVYTKAVNDYEAIGKEKIIFDEKGIPVKGDIVPYLRITEPLFAVAMQHLKINRFSGLQRAGLLSIVLGQLRPLVVTMKEEMERLGRDMSQGYNQIAERQLTEIDALLATSKQ